MRKLAALFILAFIALGSRPVLREVFISETYIKIPSKFYFTPVVKGKGAVAFAYISKVEPTEEELKAERERLRKIIDEGIKREYGSYENYEKEMEKVGKKTQEEFNKKAPPKLRDLMPPSLFAKGVPLLMKGILLFARNLPFVSSPTGNLGETGVVILRQDLKPVVIKLGINEPVEVMDFSPDGKYLAVLSDLSYEDDKKFHVVGKISVIELEKNAIVLQTVLANIQDRLWFAPDGKYLTFLSYRLGKSERKIYFMRTGTWKIEPRPFTYRGGTSSLSVYGRTIHWPSYQFSPDGKLMIYRGIHYNLHVLSYPELKELFTIPGVAARYYFSPDGRYLIDEKGRLWDLKTGKMLWEAKKRMKFEELKSARFFDHRVYITSIVGTRAVDLRSGRDILMGDFFSRLHMPILSPDGKYLVSIERVRKGPSMVRYGRRMKVANLEVHVVDTSNLRLVQIIKGFNPAALDLVFFGDKLLVSDYEGIWVYREK